MLLQFCAKVSRNGFAATAVMLVGYVMLSSSVAAATFFSATTTESSLTTAPDGGLFGSVDNISNGSGLPGGVAGLTDATISIIQHSLGFNANNQVVRDGGTTAADFTFNFDTPTDIDRLHLWNFTQDDVLSNRGINEYDIFVNGSATASFSGSFAEADNDTPNHVAQVLEFGVGGLTGVTSLRLDATSNHGGNAIGLDEVVFSVGEILEFPVGDVTLDGNVDSDDFERLSQFMLQDVLAVDDPNNPNMYSGRQQGDLNGSGRVDLVDFGIFKDDPTRVAGSIFGEITAVPEPSTLLLLGISSILISSLRRSSSH